MPRLKEMQSNTLLNNPRVKEEITMEIGIYFEFSRNENRNKSKLVGIQLKEYSYPGARIQGPCELVWGKNYIFILNNMEPKFSISFSREYRQRTTMVSWHH